MKKILLATTNKGKIEEYKELLKDCACELLTLRDLNVNTQPEEDGKTFKENAIKKAEFYSKCTELPLLAEDSGIEIDYLNGEPGVVSRRWPGYEATDQELINMTLSKLDGVPKEKRGAQFRVVIALKLGRDDKILTSEGVLRGYILEEQVGNMIPGYPYRSLFYVPEIGKVLGTMDMKAEARCGHRKAALHDFLSLLCG